MASCTRFQMMDFMFISMRWWFRTRCTFGNQHMTPMTPGAVAAMAWYNVFNPPWGPLAVRTQRHASPWMHRQKKRAARDWGIMAFIFCGTAWELSLHPSMLPKQVIYIMNHLWRFWFPLAEQFSYNHLAISNSAIASPILYYCCGSVSPDAPSTSKGKPLDM